MGKVMGKLKHNYNAFPELQTKFFHKQCVISTKFPHAELYTYKPTWV